MRLIDALLKVDNNSNIYIINALYKVGLRYNESEKDIWCCDKRTGEYSYNTKMCTGYNQLFEEGWEARIVVEPKYRIGDKFLFTSLGCEVCHHETIISKKEYSNVIVEVNRYYVKENRIFYTVCSKDEGITLVLTEEYLSNLDMVVSQDMT